MFNYFQALKFVNHLTCYNIINMSDLSQITNSLQTKCEKLIYLHKKLEEENLMLINERNNLLESNGKLKTTINNLEEKNKIVKLAKSLSETNENSLGIKLKINELVRDIDKCIALLNR